MSLLFVGCGGMVIVMVAWNDCTFGFVASPNFF